MQYKSPIKTLTPFLQKNEKLEEMDLNSLKKRILAEFELSGKSSIKTKSGEFSKSDILAIIENVKSSDDFKFHAKVAKFPQLVSLLEDAKITAPFSFQDEQFQDPQFVEFISPYAAHALGRYYTNYLKDSKRYMTYTLQKDLPVLEKDVHLMIEPVYKIFESVSQKLEKITSKISNSKELVDARIYFTNNSIRVINHLPKKYFTDAIEMFTIQGYNLLVTHLQNRKKQPWYDPIAKDIFHQLKKVRGRGNVFSEVLQLSQYFDPIEPDKELEENKGCSVPIRLAIAIIVIIIFIGRNGGC